MDAGQVERIDAPREARFSDEQLAACALELARRQCVRGNPFPLIAQQWPGLVISDPAEAAYFEGTIGSVTDPCLRLDFWQRDFIRSVFTDGITEVFTKGCTKAGKGAAAAIAVNLWFWLFAACKIILTGPKVDHVIEGIFAECAMWRRAMRHPGEGEIQAKGYKTQREEKYLTIGNAGTGEGFSGKHGPATLYLFDEASIIGDDFYALAQTQARMIIALSNPRTTLGWFRRGFPKGADADLTQTVAMPGGRRRLVTVSGLDCLNVKTGRNLIPNQLTPAVLAKTMAKSPFWARVFGEGKFPLEDPEAQLILPSWLERHQHAWQELRRKIEAKETPIPKPRAFGLDVAASDDGDLTVLAAATLDGILGLHPRRGADTMETVGWVLAVAKEQYGVDLPRDGVPIVVDTVGVGRGVYDRLREIGVRALPSTGQPKDKTRFANRRAEMYGTLADRLDPQGRFGCTEPFYLPADAELTEELVAPEKIHKSDGSFRLTPKDRKPGVTIRGETLRERLGRSPDKADAVVYAFSVIWRLIGRRVPKLNRPLLASAFGDQKKPMPKLPRLEDLPPAQPVTPGQDRFYDVYTSIDGPREIVDLVRGVVEEWDLEEP